MNWERIRDQTNRHEMRASGVFVPRNEEERMLFYYKEGTFSLYPFRHSKEHRVKVNE